MPRQDGRIEQGQSLKSAISARAWNRAQDAADIVLGGQYGFAGQPEIPQPQALYRSVRVVKPSPFRQLRFGMIVFSSTGVPSGDSNQNAIGVIPPGTVGLDFAEPSYAVAFSDRRQTANKTFGVIVSGTLPEQNGGATVAKICTNGTCLAIVRKNPGVFLPKVRPAVIRYDSDTQYNLQGIAEDTECGPADLVYWTNIRAFSASRQNAENVASPEPLDETLENVYYAVVRL